jgi:hypothetical protein
MVPEEDEVGLGESCMSFVEYIYNQVQAIARVELPLYYEGKKYFRSHSTFMLSLFAWGLVIFSIYMIFG